MKDLAKLLSLVISLIFSIYMTSLDFTTFDMYNHLFFSKHYKENWFSLIDQKLSAGLDLSSYPPLIHQIIALLSFIFPLKASYYFTLIIFWILLSYFSAGFFLDYLKVRNKFWLVYLFIFFSTGILVSIFVFGQITTIAGLAFGFISLYYFNRFLRKDNLKNIILSSISLSLSAFSNNFSFLLVAIFYLFLLVFEWKVLLRKPKDFTLFLIFTLFLVSIVYYPLIQKSVRSSLVPQQEIWHWSRYPFTSSINFERWLSIYGILIFMLAFPVLLILSKVKNWKEYLKLYLIAIFFFLLGLGRTTPLTKIFLGLEHWLTYERFSLVSSIVFASLFVLFIPEPSSTEISFRKHRTNILPIIFLILFVSINIEWLYYSHTLFFGHPVKHSDNKRQEITSYVLSFLNNVSSNYRYQTFGYGRPIGEIYFYSKLPTLDTDYFTGRTVDWMKNSGIDEIDQAKDKNFLDTFMNFTNKYSVKYIVTFNDFYHQYMKLYDWKLLESKSFDGKNVMIWENPNKIKEVSSEKEEIGIFNYLWGILPLATLFVFLEGKPINEDR
jgi:MFS family permease